MIDPMRAAQVELAKSQVAATLAAALIGASGRPFSVQEAADLLRDFRYALYPDPSLGAYKEWEKTKGERLRKVVGPNT